MSEDDRKVIETLGEVLLGSDRPLVIASGTGLVDRTKNRGPALETDDPVGSAAFPRAATEEAASALVAKGGRMIVMRLKMQVKSITPEEASEYFDSIAGLAALDLAASSTLTRQQLGWNPTGPDLLTDLRNMDYSVA
jgi:hypothetical protein